MLNTTITHRTHPFLPPWPAQTLGPECLLLVEFLPTDEANIPVEPATSAAVGDANATEPAPPVAPVRSMDARLHLSYSVHAHQFVESLRVKIQVLEEELARLHALNQEQARRAVGSDAPAPADGVLPGDETLPGQSRPAIPSIAPLSGDYAQQFSRLTPQNKHSAITAGVTGRPLGTIYQFIFNINPSVPPNEQPEAVQQSLVCDWHRYLPPLDDIQFTRLEHDTLLDRCFKYSSCWLMMVIPQFFLWDMLRALTYSQEPAEVEYYSPLLHCSLLAFATALSDDPLVKQRGQKFAERAKQLLDDSLRRPCLSLVQSLAILSEYHCGLGGKEQGYIYLGMSIRAVRARKLPSTGHKLRN
ncbi:hypothetical protein FS749_014979 [Ceratobasidium sp. UAMH 11750]|nr:hypothetical protein FS749_014979 [Ceratobasidium sp. UAMH 11750]